MRYTCTTATSRAETKTSVARLAVENPRVSHAPLSNARERRIPGLETVGRSSSGRQAARIEAGASLRLLTHVVLNVEFRLVGVVAFSGLQLPESRPDSSLDRFADLSPIVSYRSVSLSFSETRVTSTRNRNSQGGDDFRRRF